MNADSKPQIAEAGEGARAPSQPPVRYCARCRELLEPKRVMRNAFFCDPKVRDCRKDDKRERRQYRAGKNCRLCGRAARRPRAHQQAIEQSEGVRREHNAGSGQSADGSKQETEPIAA